jgi:hypothetical protein
MIGELVMATADDRVPVGAPGMHRQQFTEIDACDIGPYRPEQSPVLYRGIRLHVVGLHVRRTTRQPDEYDRSILHRLPCVSGSFLGSQQIG